MNLKIYVCVQGWGNLYLYICKLVRGTCTQLYILVGWRNLQTIINMGGWEEPAYNYLYGWVGETCIFHDREIEQSTESLSQKYIKYINTLKDFCVHKSFFLNKICV